MAAYSAKGKIACEELRRALPPGAEAVNLTVDLSMLRSESWCPLLVSNVCPEAAVDRSFPLEARPRGCPTPWAPAYNNERMRKLSIFHESLSLKMKDALHLLAMDRRLHRPFLNMLMWDLR